MRVNLINRNAVIGMFIGERNDRSKGIGSEATNLLLDFGFNVLNLKNIMIETYSFNALNKSNHIPSPNQV